MRQKYFSTHINKLVPFVELFAKALSFISVIIITRLVSVESFGAYYYIVSLVAWASVFMDGGVSYFIINKSVKDDIENLGEYLVSRVIFSLVTILILGVTVAIFRNSYVWYVLLYSFSFLFILLTAFFKIIARTQNKVKLDMATVLLEPLLRVFVLIIVFLSLSNVSLELIFVILLLSALVAFILSFFYFKKEVPVTLNYRISFNKMWNVLKETKVYLFMYLFLVGLKRVEIVIAKYKFSEYDSGIYSSADNFYNSAYLFFTSLILVVLKKHYQLNKKEKRNNFLILASLAFASVVFFYLFSVYIYSVFYSNDYMEGHYLLSVLSISLLFTPFIYFYILDFNHKNKTSLNAKILAFCFMVKILFLLLTENIYQFCYAIVIVDVIILTTYFLISKIKPLVKTTI